MTSETQLDCHRQHEQQSWRWLPDSFCSPVWDPDPSSKLQAHALYTTRLSRPLQGHKEQEATSPPATEEHLLRLLPAAPAGTGPPLGILGSWLRLVGVVILGHHHNLIPCKRAAGLKRLSFNCTAHTSVLVCACEASWKGSLATLGRISLCIQLGWLKGLL